MAHLLSCLKRVEQKVQVKVVPTTLVGSYISVRMQLRLLARKPPTVGVHSNTTSGTEKQIPRCRLTMQRYISVPRFEVPLVTESLVSYCLTRWSSWCKWRKFSSSDSGRVSASSDLATLTTSMNSTVTTSLTSRIALQTEEPCIELEWVVVMPSVVWQLCLFGGSEGWRVWSQKLCHRAHVWSGPCVGFLSEKQMAEMRIRFYAIDWKLGRSKPSVPNYYCYSRTRRFITANTIARHWIRFRASSIYLRLSESVFYRPSIMLGLLHFSNFPTGCYSGGSPPKFWKYLFSLPFKLHAWRIVVWPSSLSWRYCLLTSTNFFSESFSQLPPFDVLPSKQETVFLAHKKHVTDGLFVSHFLIWQNLGPLAASLRGRPTFWSPFLHHRGVIQSEKAFEMFGFAPKWCARAETLINGILVHKISITNK